MSVHSCAFSKLPGRYAIARLPADAPVPESILTSGGFASVTRTSDELSIVCDEARVPPGVRSETGWCVLKLHGPFAFDQVGILASWASPLAQHGVSIFSVSTFDTDYVLVKDSEAARAIGVLENGGHTFVGDPSR